MLLNIRVITSARFGHTGYWWVHRITFETSCRRKSSPQQTQLSPAMNGTSGMWGEHKTTSLWCNRTTVFGSDTSFRSTKWQVTLEIVGHGLTGHAYVWLPHILTDRMLLTKPAAFNLTQYTGVLISNWESIFNFYEKGSLTTRTQEAAKERNNYDAKD